MYNGEKHTCKYSTQYRGSVRNLRNTVYDEIIQQRNDKKSGKITSWKILELESGPDIATLHSFSEQEEFGKLHPGWDGNIEKLFLRSRVRRKTYGAQRLYTRGLTLPLL